VARPSAIWPRVGLDELLAEVTVDVVVANDLAEK
jgi:hypothetical protein